MSPRRRYVRLTKQDRAQVAAWAAERYPKFSLDEIAADAGLSRNTVRKLLVEAGVTIQAPSRTRRAKAWRQDEGKS